MPVLGIQTPLLWPLGPRGREATDPTEYPVTDWTEEGVRQVNRYPMSAPGDVVWDQLIRLETGRFTDPERRGQRLEGNEAHGWVVQEDTDAWANILGVIEGGEVIPYVRERTWWGRQRSVYDDDDYPGTDPVPLDSLPGGGG